MLKAEQVPYEVVEAARYAFHNATGPTVADDWHVALAAALNAWPEVKRVKGYFTHDTDYYEPAIILPLNTETDNAEV